MTGNATTMDALGRSTADAGQRPLATAWLGLGIAALALAGLFAILLVVARAPGTAALFPAQDFFRIALIVHVDQSVLIWFLAFAGVLWSLGNGASPGLSWLGFAVAAAGCLLAAAAPFLGAADPLLNNYVPVLDHTLFLAALALFGLGVLVQLAAYLLRAFRGLSWRDPLAVGTATVAAALLITGISLVWTWFGLAPEWTGLAYYEYLFWGPGHVLQFVYTQLMLVAWLWLAGATERPVDLSDFRLSALLVLGVLPLLAVPVVHGLYAPDSAETRLAFTWLMQYGNAVAAVPIGLLLGVSLLRHRRAAVPEGQRPAYRALLASVVLFWAGGLLGASITGTNTVIPAHYHGSIVGVTLALMGLTYLLLPELGFGRPVGRMACWQPVVYGAGQMLHIAGLAASGAMGMQRKTAGAAQGLEGVWTKTFMGIMGLGGLLAVIGGILFVIVVLGAFTQRSNPSPHAGSDPPAGRRTGR